MEGDRAGDDRRGHGPSDAASPRSRVGVERGLTAQEARWLLEQMGKRRRPALTGAEPGAASAERLAEFPSLPPLGAPKELTAVISLPSPRRGAAHSAPPPRAGGAGVAPSPSRAAPGSFWRFG